jgi:hypothetical protein
MARPVMVPANDRFGTTIHVGLAGQELAARPERGIHNATTDIISAVIAFHRTLTLTIECTVGAG